MHTAGVLELRLVAKGLVLGMRCTSVSLRNKWTGLVGKLLRRISSSIHFILHKWSSGPGSAGSLGMAEQAEKARDIACETPVLLSVSPLCIKDSCTVKQEDLLESFQQLHLHSADGLASMCICINPSNALGAG